MLVKEYTRELARIIKIDAIAPIPKSDFLELATVGVWEVIVSKGMYQPGDTALYLEIDAAIPLDHKVLETFDKKRLKVTEDELGAFAVIKTLRLRGVLSQGLILNKSSYATLDIANKPAGTNVTEALGVYKYVSPEEAKLYAAEAEEESNRKLTGTQKLIWKFRNWLIEGITVDGLQPWPVGQIKSEQKRLQNIPDLYKSLAEADETAELSVKLNGESALFYTDKTTNEVGVAQRNFGLRTEDIEYTRKESWLVYLSDWVRFISRRLRGGKCSMPYFKKGYLAQSVPLVKYFHKEKLGSWIELFNAGLQDPNTTTTALAFAYKQSVSIQGEMVGPDFNKNAEGVKKNTFYAYNVYLSRSGLVTPEQARLITTALGIEYVPVLDEKLALNSISIAQLLAKADAPASFDPKRRREGLVAKCNKTKQSFKIISNKWLEEKSKQEDQEEAKAAEEAVVA